MRSFDSLIAITTACLIGAATVVAEPPPGTITIFLSPTGSDAAAGTEAEPVATFGRAMALVGNESATIRFLPGDYTFFRVEIPARDLAPQATLVLRPHAGKGTVRIFSRPAGFQQVWIAGSNVTIMDLRFFSLTQNAVYLLTEAKGTVIENCHFDMMLSNSEETQVLFVDEGAAPVLEKTVIKDNTFILPSFAAVRIRKPVKFLHIIGNTMHLGTFSPALLVETDDYSGIVVDNNILSYPVFAGSYPIEFKGRGEGTRINLNCYASTSGNTGNAIANKLATNTLPNLVLSFRDLDPTDPEAGQSHRGTCFDIYTQEKLSVLK